MLVFRPKVLSKAWNKCQPFTGVFTKIKKISYVPFYIMYRQPVERFKHPNKDDIVRYLLYFKSDVRLRDAADFSV